MNNKGFAISSILYVTMASFLMILAVLLFQYASSINILNNANTEIINGGVSAYFYEEGDLTDNNKLAVIGNGKTIYWPKDFGLEFICKDDEGKIVDCEDENDAVVMHCEINETYNETYVAPKEKIDDDDDGDDDDGDDGDDETGADEDDDEGDEEEEEGGLTHSKNCSASFANIEANSVVVACCDKDDDDDKCTMPVDPKDLFNGNEKYQCHGKKYSAIKKYIIYDKANHNYITLKPDVLTED